MTDNACSRESQHGTPTPDWPIEVDLVQFLVRTQHPDLADLSVTPFDEGWDNVMFRLGDKFLIRLPRREVAVSSLKIEQEWLPKLASTLPIPVPVPLRIGQPCDEFPWPWSIVASLPGKTADQDYPGRDQAKPFAQFLRALHQPTDAILPPGNSRGLPLETRRQKMAERIQRMETATNLISPKIVKIWQDGVAAPLAHEDERRWIHGDLHARNVLTRDGVICGIIDWGDLFVGDVAIDLASVWMLFDDVEAQEICLDEYHAGGAELTRALGWASFLGVLLLDTGLVDNPSHAQMGRDILRRLDQWP